MKPLNRKLIDAAKLLQNMRFTGGFIHNGQIYVPLREIRQAIRNAPAVDAKQADTTRGNHSATNWQPNGTTGKYREVKERKGQDSIGQYPAPLPDGGRETDV